MIWMDNVFITVEFFNLNGIVSQAFLDFLTEIVPNYYFLIYHRLMNRLFWGLKGKSFGTTEELPKAIAFYFQILSQVS